MDAFCSWGSSGGVGVPSGAGECCTALATSEASSCADGWWWASEDRPCTVRAIVGQLIAIRSTSRESHASACRSWERRKSAARVKAKTRPSTSRKPPVTRVTLPINEARLPPSSSLTVSFSLQGYFTSILLTKITHNVETLHPQNDKSYHPREKLALIRRLRLSTARSQGHAGLPCALLLNTEAGARQ